MDNFIPKKAVDFLLYNTVLIEGKYENGDYSEGTGFFFNYKKEIFIVTAKHVIENTKDGYITFNVKHEEHQKSTNKYCYDFSELWFSNKLDDIDVAVCNISNIYKENEWLEQNIKGITIDEWNFLSPQEKYYIQSLEQIFFIGFPVGNIEEFKDVPLVRMGITATNILMSKKGRECFIIDASSFEGSSGSPVFLYDKQLISNNLGNPNIVKYVKFLGILTKSLLTEEEKQEGKRNGINNHSNLGLVLNENNLKNVLDEYFR